MSCMTATINPVKTGLSVSVSSPDAVRAYVVSSTLDIAVQALLKQVKYAAEVLRDGLGVLPNIARVNANLSLTVTLTCSTAVPKEEPYLDIAPKILWIWTMPANNDVFSNTNWNID